MNDFTKEELESLLYLTEECCKEYRASNDNDNDLEDFWIPLKHKIFKTIDNYCDYEYKKTLDKSGMYFINMCHKCHDRIPY